MSINKGTDKVKPYPVCGIHGVLCSCTKIGSLGKSRMVKMLEKNQSRGSDFNSTLQDINRTIRK